MNSQSSTGPATYKLSNFTTKYVKILDISTKIHHYI